MILEVAILHIKPGSGKTSRLPLQASRKSPLLARRGDLRARGF
jgi:hypothetical protein